MKSGEPMGLVGSVRARESFLARLPAVLTRLGPLKGTTFAASRRLVRLLRAGYAVDQYSALEYCPLIWIDAAESRLRGIVCDLLAQTPMDGTIVVTCGSIRDSIWLASCLKPGVRTASLTLLGDEADGAFVLEGDPEAVAAVGRLLHEDRRRFITIEPPNKRLLLAGVHFAKDLMLPYFAAAVDCLRSAGLSRSEAARAAQELSVQSLRAYVRAGEKGWSSEVNKELRRVLQHDLELLERTDPKSAGLFAEGVEQATARFPDRSVPKAIPTAKTRPKSVARKAGAG